MIGTPMHAPKRCAAGTMGSCPANDTAAPGPALDNPTSESKLSTARQRLAFVFSAHGNRSRVVVLWTYRAEVPETLVRGALCVAGGAALLGWCLSRIATVMAARMAEPAAYGSRVWVA